MTQFDLEPTKLTGPETPRYLIDFSAKRIAHYFTDVLIIGGGLAGMRAVRSLDLNFD